MTTFGIFTCPKQGRLTKDVAGCTCWFRVPQFFSVRLIKSTFGEVSALKARTSQISRVGFEKRFNAMTMQIENQYGKHFNFSKGNRPVFNILMASCVMSLMCGWDWPLQAVTIRQIAANLFHHAAKPPSEDSRQKARRLAWRC